jgi:type IV pilus assembly protein PilB
MNYLNTPEVNIISIEDPIEYNLRGINQTQVRPDIGLTFANILRTILRQDPNIIMVGEIRDSETSEMAIRSAHTGHLVLSTLHTNDALSAITRLTDMGIERYLLANSLKLVVAQRLIRKICPKCKVADHRKHQLRFDNEFKTLPRRSQLFIGSGCSHCHGSGYFGREAVMEQLEIDEKFSDLILQKAGHNDMRKLARAYGMDSLHSAAMEKAFAGVTTIDEVISETLL